MKTIVLATHNLGKAREFSRLLELSDITVKTLADFGVDRVPKETGSTFLENARIKAKAAMKATGMPSLADDSGLCVDALGGAPGVYSADYGGPAAPPSEKNELLLREMAGKPDRKARFICQLVLLYPDGREVLAEGRCEGEILERPRGSGGFGYDPIFFSTELGHSLAELSPAEKNLVSHRGKAIRSLMRLI